MPNNDDGMLWGKTTWVFLHTLAEKINDDFYIKNRHTILDMVRKICYNLPCPFCVSHASMYINNVSIKNIPDKKSFGKMLFDFHNSVNNRRGEPFYPYNKLIEYQKVNMEMALRNFSAIYGKRYSRMLRVGMSSTEKRRAKLTYSIVQWCRSNWNYIS